MGFTKLGVSSPLNEALRTLGIAEPTPIQSRVIPSALRGESVLVTSQTGSGKTLAYLLPLLERLSHSQSTALVLAPTRELAQQIGGVCSQLCGESLSHCVIFGGVEYESQREALAKSPNIIVATPGRLLDLLGQGVVLGQVEHFVLDEVDQMLDLGFAEPIAELAKLRALGAQTLCFSATLPDGVNDVVKLLVPNIKHISIEGESLSVAQIEQFGYFVSFEMMDRLLIHLLQQEVPDQAIIFTRSRKMADRIVGLLAQNSYSAESMHSDRSQVARQHILQRFRDAQTSIIVATDVMARGIDIEGVSHVFNFGLPLSAEQ